MRNRFPSPDHLSEGSAKAVSGWLYSVVASSSFTSGGGKDVYERYDLRISNRLFVLWIYSLLFVFHVQFIENILKKLQQCYNNNSDQWHPIKRLFYRYFRYVLYISGVSLKNKRLMDQKVAPLLLIFSLTIRFLFLIQNHYFLFISSVSLTSLLYYIFFLALAIYSTKLNLRFISTIFYFHRYIQWLHFKKRLLYYF